MALFLGGAGCSNPPLAPKATAASPASVPVRASLQELMEQADAATRQGAADRAQLRLREAAQTYPAAKQPWARLADGYFAAGDYGNAILAAQEVLHRDPQDRVAHGILALGGLRVSVGSISFMRAQQTGVPVETRAQATELSKTLREALGEPGAALAARPGPQTSPTTAGSAAAQRTDSARAEPVRSSAQPPALPPKAARAVAPAAVPAAAPAAAAAVNPLDRLR